MSALRQSPRPSLWRSANPPMRDWQDLRVWVVGASSGIGRACAHALWQAGAQVIVSARQTAALQGFVDEHPAGPVPMEDLQNRSSHFGRLAALGFLPRAWAMGYKNRLAATHPAGQHGTAQQVLQALPRRWQPQAETLDVTDSAACQAVAQRILANGPLDMVLYCAGHYRAMRATAMDVPDIHRHNAINYLGAVHVTNAVLPAMRTRGQGHLSFISSVAGFRGLPNGLAYGPTKAALTHWAQTLYLDLAPHGLGVSVVHPGFVQTPLTAQNEFQMPGIITPEKAARAMLRDWAAGRFESHYPKRFSRVMKCLRWLPDRLYFVLVRRITGL
jgi:NAD(P)-dependent dehydrogenase (short-subunit alcohol dehydrogenase family)